MTPDDLGELYRTFQESAWRLEARDVYAVPGDDEDFDAYLVGRPVPPRTVENSSWLRNVRAVTEAGRYFGRVRLVGHPITDYTRFEFASYPENIAAGEDVRVVDRRHLDATDEGWTHQDFWLFDDQIAVLQFYSDDGRFIGVEAAPDVRPYVEVRRRAADLSVGFGAYRLGDVRGEGTCEQPGYQRSAT